MSSPAVLTRSPVPDSALPLALLLIVGTLLGVFTTLVKAAVAAGWDPLAYLFWALAGSGIIVLAIATWSGQRPRLDRGALTYYLGAGLLSGALPNALSFAAVPHVGAAFVALGFSFPPLFSYIFALALRIERFKSLRAIGLLTALVGAVLLVVAKVSIEGTDLVWLAIALAAPVVVAIGNIYRSLYWPRAASPLSLAPGMLIGAATILGLTIWPSGVPFTPPLDAETVALAVALVIVFSATYSLIFVLQKLAGPVYLSQIGSVGAAAGASIAVAVYGEPLGPGMVVATVFILIGVYLVNRTR